MVAIFLLYHIDIQSSAGLRMRGKQLDPTDVPVPEGERIFVDKLLRPYQGQGRPALNCADAAFLVPADQSLNGLAGGTGSEGRSSQGSAGSTHLHASTASKAQDSQEGAFALACTCVVLCVPMVCWDRLPSQRRL